jgi:amino acid transporter
MIGSVRRFLIGQPLPTVAGRRERLGISRGIGAFGLDALSSVAYGPDEILYVLILAGAVGTAFAFPVALAIAALLLIVVTSYRQTINAYPHGGGSYTVARENLGRRAGLVAAAALMVDYVTTLAVSVTAGIEAIVAFAPALDAYRVPCDLAAIALLVLINLRGVREAGAFFVLPTYVFVLSLASLVGLGLWRVLAGDHLPVQQLPQATEGVSLFLIARAFAGGCTAMTGVEAIANGVPVFKKPESRTAARTLVILAAVLGALFLGVAYLGKVIAAHPSDQASVIAQIGRAVAPNSPLFYLVQVASAMILVLAANTSFNGFPLLAAIMAEDGYLPHQFAHRGARLALSNGIIAIAVVGATLIVVFRGSTHALIPLFAIGVFLSFTLSQGGMVRHWLKLGGPGWRTKLAVNGVGAVTTALVTVVVLSSKFLEGAWIIAIIIPVLVLTFQSIHRHYASAERQTRTKEPPRHQRHRHRVLIPVSEIDSAVKQTLEYALGSADDVTAIHVAVDPAAARRLKRAWENWAPEVPLVVLESPYREVVTPLVDYIRQERERRPDHQVMVMVPEVIPRSWAQEPLHNQTAFELRAALRHMDDVAMGLVPYRLQ